jgi:glycosyltransferase domain-containing protein
MLQKIKFHQTSFLILVKDQKFFSKKLVNHINNQNIEAEFIIADGSKKKQNQIFNKLKFKKKYYYFGEDKNLQIFFKKVLKSLKKTKKKFVFFCDQDDLINFETIKKKEKFLLINKDYSAAKGVLYNFRYNNKKISIIGKTYSSYTDFNFFFLRHMFNASFRSYYCLHKTKNLKKSFELITKYNLKDFRSAEFVIDFSTISSGRIKFFKNTSVLRWAGVKDKIKIHPLYEVHSNRYAWFKYFFTNNRSLIDEILKKNKTIFNNFYFFKIYIFIFDICHNYIVRKLLNLKLKFIKGKY